MTNTLNPTEQKAVEICARIQKLCEVLGKNLHIKSDIHEDSKHLVQLYELQRVLDSLRDILPKHEVINQDNGESLGYLYDNEYIEGVMLSTNINVNSAIQHVEWHIGVLSRNLIL